MKSQANSGARQRLAAPVLVLLCGAVTGCFGGKNPDARCNDPEEYQQSVSVPEVKVPEGLVAPDKASSYTVPAPALNAEVRGAACLARPPDYFRKDPVAAPAK